MTVIHFMLLQNRTQLEHFESGYRSTWSILYTQSMHLETERVK